MNREKAALLRKAGSTWLVFHGVLAESSQVDQYSIAYCHFAMSPRLKHLLTNVQLEKIVTVQHFLFVFSVFAKQ